MKRQVTIYESALNGKITVLNDVEVSTLGELKELLRQKGINYSGMDFIEGVTNTKLLNDDSRIPENIPFKGKVTNNVFINILKKESKISSGCDYESMSRKDLLAIAKEYAQAIAEAFGRNFTQVKSIDLIHFLEENENEEDNNECNEEEECPDYVEVPLVEAVVTMINTLGIGDAVVEALTQHEDDAKHKDNANKSEFTAEDIAKFVNR